MKSILGATCAALVLAALAPSQAWANPQHERMRHCNAQAKERSLKGEERKAFMSTCLRGSHEAVPGAASAGAPATAAGTATPAAAAAPAAAVAPPAPIKAAAAAPVDAAPPAPAAGEDKARAKACNRAATEQSLRGAKRKAFIAECLNG